MTAGRGPLPGEAKGDGRRPSPIEHCRLLERGAGVAQCLFRGSEVTIWGPKALLWTVAVRLADGQIVRVLRNGLPVEASALPGLVADLARTMAREAPAPGSRGS